MCYHFEKSSGFEDRVNEAGDGLVAKLCNRSKVIARNGTVATEELSGRAMFVGPLYLCLLICEGRGGGQRKPGLATEPERSVSEPENAAYPRGREAATPGPPRREKGDGRRRGPRPLLWRARARDAARGQRRERAAAVRLPRSKLHLLPR